MLRYWHLVSLDAPTVAVTWALAFAWVARVHLEPWALLLLACGTWTVYVLDRLLDAYRGVGEPARLRERHFFHWRHRRMFIPLALCSAGAACMLIVRLMPAVARDRNSVLAAAALAYFSGVHAAAKPPLWLRNLVPKELLVGVIFTAGCAAPTFTRTHALEWPLGASFVFFAALAWLNCSAIEHWESGLIRSGMFSRAAFLGLLGLATIVCTLAHPRAAALLCTGSVSAILLALLDHFGPRITLLAQRALADLVLLSPIALFAFGSRIG